MNCGDDIYVYYFCRSFYYAFSVGFHRNNNIRVLLKAINYYDFVITSIDKTSMTVTVFKKIKCMFIYLSLRVMVFISYRIICISEFL